MTSEQVKWAKLHDWFIYCVEMGIDKFEVVCNDGYGIPSGEWVERVITFSDFNAMKEWAGY